MVLELNKSVLAFLQEQMPLAAIQAGTVEGLYTIHKFGSNSNVDIATAPEALWEGGGVYPYQTGTVSIEGISDSAQDGVAGTGALTITVEGLDENWDRQSETFTTNGTSAVAIAGTWRRIFRAYVVTSGSGSINAGTVDIQIASAGAVLAKIGVGTGQTLMATYTVPAGYTALVGPWQASSLAFTGGTETEVALIARYNDDSGTNAIRYKSQVGLRGGGSSSVTSSGSVPTCIPEKTDIEISVTVTDADDTKIVGSFDLLVIQTSIL